MAGKEYRSLATFATTICFLAALLFALMPLAENCIISPQWAVCGDFKSYYAASVVLRGPSPAEVYKPLIFTTMRKVFPDTAVPQVKPPPVLVLPNSLPIIWPISLIPSAVASSLWTALLVLSSAGATLLFAWRARLSPLGIAVMCLLVSISGPYHSLIRLGEFAPIGLLLLASVLISLEKKHALLAAVALVPMTIKPHWVLPLLAYLSGARRFRALAWLALFTAILALVSASCFGIDVYKNYLALSAWMCRNPWIFPINATASSQVQRWFPNVPYTSIMPVTAAFYGCSLLFLCWLGNRFKDHRNWLECGVVSAFPIGIACACYYSPYDMFLLVPCLVVLLQPRNLQRMPIVSRIAIGIATCSLINPFYRLIINAVPATVINPFSVAMWLLALSAVHFVLTNETESTDKSPTPSVPAQLSNVTG